MRGALLTLLGTVVLMAGLVGLFTWTPWDDDQSEREHSWLTALADWTYGYERPPACEKSLSDAVGDAPTARLEPVHEVALAGCSRGAWDDVAGAVESKVISIHAVAAAPSREPDLSRHAVAVAGSGVVHCWSEEDWTSLADHVAALSFDEFWLLGLADPASGRIDLAPEVCEPLQLFVRTRYAPRLNDQSFELSQALVVLAHEAEHLRKPNASEAEVECYALQRVRELVRRAGRGRWYQNEMALLAWELGYPDQLDDYRTELCYDGGPLDLHPRSRVWP